MEEFNRLPKWKEYTLDKKVFTVTLDNGRSYTGDLKRDSDGDEYIHFGGDHYSTCDILFGQIADRNEKLACLLDIPIYSGAWPETKDVALFIKRFYDRIVSIKTKPSSKIIIELESDIIPKFTI